MRIVRRLSHSAWEWRHRIVFIPKYRRKQLYGELLMHPGKVFRDLARLRGTEIEEGHRMPDQVHMLIAIPPEYAAAQGVRFIKGKNAIPFARNYLVRRRNYRGQHFWALGYFVSTVGRGEARIRQYIRNQGVEDQRIDQLTLE